MCRPVTCKTCGKTTWAGCGQHVSQVRASVPPNQWCGGHGDRGAAKANPFVILGLVLAVLVVGWMVVSNRDSGSDSSAPSPAASAEVVSTDQAKSLIDDGAVVIDVRTPAEFAAGHLAEASNLDWESGQFTTELADLDPSASYVLYCHSGNRAGQAAQAMIDAGFSHVVNAGGYDALTAAGLS